MGAPLNTLASGTSLCSRIIMSTLCKENPGQSRTPLRRIICAHVMTYLLLRARRRLRRVYVKEDDHAGAPADAAAWPRSTSQGTYRLCCEDTKSGRAREKECVCERERECVRERKRARLCLLGVKAQRARGRELESERACRELVSTCPHRHLLQGPRVVLFLPGVTGFHRASD
mmetsp:Transcript_84701/g.137339  ORF Transcript_84701/g.137339 Transcript_84701/m.137339 type:complete len:173 (-) Transcript_84701:363-881(-)